MVLYDERRDRQMLVTEREWRVLRAMDGTRDPEGIALASGIALAHVLAFVEMTEQLGITGEPGPEDEPWPVRDVPVVSLPGRGFSCTGIGSCCALADTILFTPLEAAAARAAAPHVLDAGHFEERAFAPASGLDRTLLAVAARDGVCAYLNPERRCSIYDSRPRGCRTHPMRYVDVGDEIRVAPRVVCACELQPSEAPLTEAKRGADLAPELWVERLPNEVRLGRATLDRADALGWSDELAPPSVDVARWCAAQADAALAPPLRLDAARDRVDALVRENAWRAPSDLLGRSLGFVAAALRRDDEMADPEAEALALSATVYVGGLLSGGDAGRALRRLETRIRIARRFPDDARKERFAQHPLAVVNAVARATGGW